MTDDSKDVMRAICAAYAAAHGPRYQAEPTFHCVYCREPQPLDTRWRFRPSKGAVCPDCERMTEKPWEDRS